MKSQKFLPAYLKQDTSLEPDEKKWFIYNTHDPSIFRDGDDYYIFSTDAVTQEMGPQFSFRGGIQVRKSKDLINWHWIGYAMEGVPMPAQEWTGAKGMWAPECFKFGSTYYLYYCASQFGTNQSFIGAAVSESIEGPWIDQGEVFKTITGRGPNAIDPNIIMDKFGDPWMIYGSFFDGIYANRLNSKNGKLLEYGKGTRIACREHQIRSGSVEGPYVIYHPENDLYYLFVSYDSLKSNYNIRVARSKDITGPYLDFNGHEMTDDKFHPSTEVGTKLMGSYRFSEYEGWLAPGHNSILRDVNGQYFIVHHVRRIHYPKRFCMHVRKLYWNSNGWPLISPECYTGEFKQMVEEVSGKWEFIVHARESDHIQSAIKVNMITRNCREMEPSEWEWEYSSETKEWSFFDSESSLNCKGKVSGIIIPSLNWEGNKVNLIFTGLDERGTAVWGRVLSQKRKK
jgi:arabinan endo-1,5-alpha-L-arabinosidase